MSAAVTPDEIAQRRKALGLTQAMLASLVRVHRCTIALYEAGQYHVPPRRAQQLASALDGVALGQEIAQKSARGAGQP